MTRRPYRAEERVFGGLVDTRGAAVARRAGDTAVRGEGHPAVVHFERARSWLRDRLPKDSDVVRVVFDETEALREWYKNGTRRSRPQSWQSGYLFAYAPLGYDRLDKLASLVPELARALAQSSEGVVMGCGPCPELWSISRRTAPGGLRLALFDEFLDDWSGVVDGFTRPLVEASLNRASVGMPDLACGEAGLDAFERIEGRVDFILAQQCLNEQVGRGRRREELLRAWLADHVNPGGAVIVIERNRNWLDTLLDGGPGRRRLPGELIEIPGSLPRDCPVIDWPSEACDSYKPRTNSEMYGVVIFAESRLRERTDPGTADLLPESPCVPGATSADATASEPPTPCVCAITEQPPGLELAKNPHARIVKRRGRVFWICRHRERGMLIGGWPDGRAAEVRQLDLFSVDRGQRITFGIALGADPAWWTDLGMDDRAVNALVEEYVRIADARRRPPKPTPPRPASTRPSPAPLARPPAVAYTSRPGRSAICYQCRTSLHSSTHLPCSECRWLVCDCGACGCGYQGLLRDDHESPGGV